MTSRLLMPVICKDMVDLLDNSNTSAANHTSLSNYAFLYGVFPTAPSVAIYAVYYNAELEVVSYLPANLLSEIFLCIHCFFFATHCMDLKLCFPTGYIWDGDQHFPLSSNNVCFCLATYNASDGSSASDEFTAESQL